MREVDPTDLVETIREGLLVLDPDLTVRFANRSFCGTFAVVPEDTVGRKLYELGNGQWDIPKLRTSLETIISGRKTIEAFEVEYFFPSTGRRTMVLNARKVYQPGNGTQQILLAIEDVTEMGRRLVRAMGVEDISTMDAKAAFGRVCRPEDVAGVVRFLCSDEADYVTGQVIAVDGGG